MKNRRLLHVYRSPSFSGAEAYAHEVAAHHAESNDVSFLARSKSPLSQKVRQNSRIHVIETLADVDFSSFEAIVLHSTQELKSLWPKLLWAKLRSRFLGQKPPRVFLYSHIWISHSKKDPLHALPYAVVDEAWASSTQSKRALEKFLPLPKSKIQIVRYGRDFGKFTADLLSRQEARSKLGLPLDAVVTGTMARVDKGKGSEELFTSVTNTMRENPGLHFLMISPPTDGDPKATDLDRELDQRLSQLDEDVRKRVHKIGRLEGGSRYLSAFDLFILATYKENFALTLLEALCAKIPCIATDSGGSPDLVKTGQTGWLVKPQSSIELRAVLTAAIQEQTIWPLLGENGHRLVTQTYGLNNVMKDLDTRIEARIS